MARSLRRRAVRLGGHSEFINVTGGPVRGIGGLSLIVLGVLVDVVSPLIKIETTPWA